MKYAIDLLKEKACSVASQDTYEAELKLRQRDDKSKVDREGYQ